MSEHPLAEPQQIRREQLTASEISHVSDVPGRDWESMGMRPGRDGKVLLSGSAAILFRAWKSHLQWMLQPYYSNVYETPVFIDRDILEAVAYAEHFPQHLIHGRACSGMTELSITPATCFHVYPLVGRHPVDAEGFGALVTGACARYEDGVWDPPFRLACFHMTELVVVGSQDFIAARRRDVQARIEKLFADLGLPGSFGTAVDAFFLGSHRGARLLQQMKELKKEFRTPLAMGPVALASVNHHEAYFGRRFGLRDAYGEHAHSLCAAFGLERLTAIGLLMWGPSPENWPEGLRP